MKMSSNSCNGLHHNDLVWNNVDEEAQQGQSRNDKSDVTAATAPLRFCYSASQVDIRRQNTCPTPTLSRTSSSRYNRYGSFDDCSPSAAMDAGQNRNGSVIQGVSDFSSEPYLSDITSSLTKQVRYKKARDTLQGSRSSLQIEASSASAHMFSTQHSVELLNKIVVPPFLFPSTADLKEVESDLEHERERDNDALHNSKLPSLTGRQKGIIAMLAFANFCSTVVFSCIAPFFPREAGLKGATETEVGLIFGIFELCIFITSPFFGRYMSTIGAKFMYTAGLLVTGSTALLFGSLSYSPPGATFIGLCFAVRIVEAVGDAAIITASFSIIANEFHGRVATVIGLLETFSGLGFTAGPTIGGALYEAGGFGLPFWVLGSMLIVAGCFSIPFIPQQKNRNSETGSTKSPMVGLVRIPVVQLMIVGIVASAVSLSFLDPTLEPHLSKLGLSAMYVGFMFLITSVTYTCTAPLIGFIIDKKHLALPIMVCGGFLSCIAFLFIGPSPIFGIKTSLLSVGFSEFILGLGISHMLIPPFSICLKVAKENGFGDNFTTYGAVSGIFQAAMSFGAFVGPTVGAALTDRVGFSWTSTIVSALQFVVAMSLLIFLCFQWRRPNPVLSKDVEPLQSLTLNDSSNVALA